MEKKEKSLRGILAQGKIPWGVAERKAFKRMCNQSKHWVASGRNAGLPDMEKICMELNARFHGGEYIRSPKALTTYKYKNF